MDNSITLFFSLLLAILVSALSLVGLRRRFFSEGYAGLWFFISLGLFIVILFPVEIKKISILLGFQNNTSFLFLLSIIVLIIVSMVQSIHISKLRKQVKDLAQSMAQNNMKNAAKWYTQSKNRNILNESPD